MTLNIIEDKLFKIEGKKDIFLSRQWEYFFSMLLLSVFILLTFLFLLLNDANNILISTAKIAILAVYFIPSIVAYDLFSHYEETTNAPSVKHPHALLILILNLTAAWTIIFWLITLYWSVRPGNVSVKIVTYSAEKL